MFAIRARGLVMTDAEEVLAKIWCGLEKYEIRTPRLVVEPVSDGIIDLRVCFRRAKDADLMLRVLEPLTGRFSREDPDLGLANVA